MHRVLVCSMVLALAACGKTDSRSSTGGSGPPASPSKAGSESSASGSQTATSGSRAAAVAVDAAPPAPGSSDGADEVAELVVHDVGSKALGSQKIDAACVSVIIMPAGEWTVASARLKDCGDKTARSILWLYKRKTGKWNEDYVGQPPKCWKGVPADIAVAVTKATKIPGC